MKWKTNVISYRTNFGPSVRLLLEKYGLSATDVPANGPHGKLLKGDILNYIKTNNIQAKAIAPGRILWYPFSYKVFDLIFDLVPAPSVVPASSPKVATPPAGPKVTSGVDYDDVEVTNMRRTIAKRLSQSKVRSELKYNTLI